MFSPSVESVNLNLKASYGIGRLEIEYRYTQYGLMANMGYASEAVTNSSDAYSEVFSGPLFHSGFMHQTGEAGCLLVQNTWFLRGSRQYACESRMSWMWR
jgi:hypothetical protein